MVRVKREGFVACLGCLLGSLFMCCIWGCGLGGFLMFDAQQQVEKIGHEEIVALTPTPTFTPTPESTNLGPTPRPNFGSGSGPPQKEPIFVISEIPPTPTPLPPEKPQIFYTRIIINHLGIDAPVVTTGVQEEGNGLIIASPPRADQVAHFYFSGLEGPLLIGHRRWINPGETKVSDGVFLHLDKHFEYDYDPSTHSNLYVDLLTSDGQMRRYIIIQKHILNRDDPFAQSLLDVNKKKKDWLVLGSCYPPYNEIEGYLKRIFIIAVPPG